MGVETTIKEIAGELEKIATTKTVVGEPITAAGKTIIPISRITMGFGAGGGEGKKDNESGLFSCMIRFTSDLPIGSKLKNQVP